KKPYLYLSTSISRTRATVSCTAGMALLRILFLRGLRRFLALPHPLDQLAPGTNESLDIGTCGPKTKAYADRAFDKLWRQPHGAQHVRRLDLSGGTRAACTDRDACKIKPDNQGLGRRARHR